VLWELLRNRSSRSLFLDADTIGGVGTVMIEAEKSGMTSHQSSVGTTPLYTLVIPVYRNAENIADLNTALIDLCGRLGPGLEIIFVIDGSPDNSATLLVEARKRLPCRSKIVFHSRNFGSFGAIRTGLELGSGEYFAAMAADLQEPPELKRGRCRLRPTHRKRRSAISPARLGSVLVDISPAGFARHSERRRRSFRVHSPCSRRDTADLRT
jgi:glycosyltransferase involved in cell wall biosynthesis